MVYVCFALILNESTCLKEKKVSIILNYFAVKEDISTLAHYIVKSLVKLTKESLLNSY